MTAGITGGGGSGGGREPVLVSGSPFADISALETWSQSNANELLNNSEKYATAQVGVSPDFITYEWIGPDSTYQADSWSNMTGLSIDQTNAIKSIIDLDNGSVPIAHNKTLIPSIQSQEGERGMNFDGEITTTKGTLNIGRGLSLGESGLSPIFRDTIENEASIPVVTPVHSDGTTDSPCYTRRYDLTNQVLQPLENETVTGNWEATVPITFTRVVTKLRIKVASNVTGVRLTLRYAKTKTQKDGVTLYQSHTDSQFNNGEGFNIDAGIFEFDLAEEAAKLVIGSFVYIVLEQNAQGTGQIELLGSTLDIGGITQFYAYLEQTYVLEEKLPIGSGGGSNVNWKRIEADYTVQDGDMFLDVVPTSSDITITVENSYPESWSGIFVYNESRRKEINIVKANGDPIVIVEKKEGQAVYFEDGAFKSTTIMGKPDGSGGIVEFDVSLDPTRTVDNTFVEKLISIVQSGQPVAIPMEITLAPHNSFETGDRISITASDEYVNYYFAVYYSSADGAQRATYPRSSIVLTRTDTDWLVEQSAYGENRYIDLPAEYADFDNVKWADVIEDFSKGSDIAYFRQAGLGSSFSNLPDSLTLTDDVQYILGTEVTQGDNGVGFAQRTSVIALTPQDQANNRTIQRAGADFSEAKADWSEATLQRDAVVYKDQTAGVGGDKFDRIVAGNNMTGEVVDGDLILNANDVANDFDELTVRVLKVHEGPENTDKFTQWAVDGNFNTEVHAVGDTHYYAKDKDSGNLTEAYQVYEDGDVEFKQAVRVNDGVNDSDAVNVSQLDTVNARVDSMLEMLVQQEAHIHSLEESNGESFGSFEIYSSNPNEVRVDMIKLNGNVVSKTVVIGNTPPPDPPTPPSGAFPVYFGWDINSRALIQASDIIDYQSTDERGADLTITDSTMLTTTYTLTRSDISEWKYMYIAYPKDVVDPNPYKVEYGGFVADWLIREVVINSHTYVVLITELPNKADTFSIKLHE